MICNECGKEFPYYQYERINGVKTVRKWVCNPHEDKTYWFCCRKHYKEACEKNGWWYVHDY